MSELIPFNVNNMVRVKLTDHGRDLLRQEHQRKFAAYGDRFPYSEPEEDAEGYSRWQLWDLMSKLGSNISLGCQMPFDSQIIMEKPGR